MAISPAIRRPFYRCAYQLLRLYWFAVRPQVHGVKCVLTDGERILFVRHTYGRAQWDLPGGALKRGELPPAAAQREMHEELGIAGAEWTALGDIEGRSNHRRDTIHCFTAEIGGGALTLDRGELHTFGWFSLDQLPSDIGCYVDPVLALMPGLRRAEGPSRSKPPASRCNP